jgi:cation:H+ antiporter
MDAIFLNYITDASLLILFVIISVLIYILGKGADIMVDEAVKLSSRLGISKVLIGVTIVSVGTTVPEASISVLAAFQGRPEIALGNAVGSIICDTGLILGLVTLFSPISLNNKIIYRQEWFQLGSGILLVLACIPYFSQESIFETGGILPQYMGIYFLVLLAIYLYGSLRFMKKDDNTGDLDYDEISNDSILYIGGKVFFGAGLVVISSHFLIPAVQESALRLSISEGIISATLVAFGTSLPELVTAITAVRKGCGELALGNIIGANILNVLFVAGAAASVTSSGLEAPVHFFKILFPAMIGSLIIFRLGIHYSGKKFKRGFSVALLSTYILVTLSSYVG